MNLVIVESPTKAKTISRFLGEDFVIKSSNGHVRDLPKSKLGVDIENNFKPNYVILEKARKILSELSKDAKKAKKIILATDEDREGEAIAWHLIEALDLKNLKTNPNIERIVFHEITERAIKEALENPRNINFNLVNSQQARRVLDRLVGYELSPFLWRKIHYGLSAGRVQSAALRLIVEREREREAFKAQEYFTILALLKKQNSSEIFEAWLVKIDEKEIPKPGILKKEEAEEIIKNLAAADFQVEKITKRESYRKPLPPFTTSTLQQAAWKMLRFSAKKTMLIAQQLYENGYITYMRTDSTNLSKESLELAKKFIEQNFGKDYILSQPRVFVTKSKLAQEAHEAIRPTDPNRTPEDLKKELSLQQTKLYELIWRRFLATQMPEAVLIQTTVEISAKLQNPKYKNIKLRSSAQSIKFDGFLKIWETKIEEKFLPELIEGEKLALAKLQLEKHLTEPPSRYTDATLVKTLEEYGIGRPSTYAPTISILEMRNYVERDERKALKPTGIGIIVTELLEKHFPEIVDYKFTAKIEDELDEIAQGKLKWQEVVKEVYEPFHQNLLIKEKEITRKEATERPSNEICESCGRQMMIKYGRFGPFLTCSMWPECKNKKKIPRQSLGIKCPNCKEGEVVIRRTRSKKRIFYGCSRWPECDFKSWKKPKTEDEES